MADSDSLDTWIDRLLDGDPLDDAEVPAELTTLSLLLRRVVEEPAEAAPGFVGPFRILETLGEGGMGSVYLAEQAEPLRRLVALKVLRGGRTSPHLVARLEMERQTLALMDHPHIATIFDAGVSDEGVPYFAMEFVRGVPLTEYARDHDLPLEARLRLIQSICAAVQHAHQRGVLHRDLKPSNLLVEVVDGRPVPKVIDFGIAKVMADESPAAGLTVEGQLLGTPEYMSPEQADGRPVDVRSDVYSLGVVLYELLTDRLPFPPEVLRGEGISQIARILRETPLPPPSAVVPALRGDLEWILTRCLEKDPARRYPGPGSLADDIGRYLGHQPVEAGPPTLRYRTSKFLRRNRVAVSFASMGLVLLVAGVVATGWQAVRAKRAETEAREEAESARAVSSFLTEMLERANPDENPEASQRSLRDLLDETTARLPDRFDGQPEVEAEIRYTLGKAYSTLGEYEEARQHLVRAIEVGDGLGLEDIAYNARQTLVTVLVRMEDLDEARHLAEEMLERSAQDRGAETWWSIRSYFRVASVAARQNDFAVADSLFVQGLELAERIPGATGAESQLVSGLSEYGIFLRRRGRLDEAEAVLLRALDIHQQHNEGPSPSRATLLGNLAMVLESQGRLEESLDLHTRSLEETAATVGRDHPSYATGLNNRATILTAFERFEEADLDLRAAEAIVRAHFGDQSPRLATTLSTLGSNLIEMGRFEEADAALEEAIGIHFALGDTLGAFTFLNNLAAGQRARGQYQVAEAGFRRARGLGVSVFGADHPQVLVVTNNIAKALEGQERWEEADREYRRVIEGARRIWSADHPNLGIMLGNHGHCLLRSGRLDEAESLLMEARGIVEPKLGADNVRTRRILGWLDEVSEARNR